MKVPYKCGGFRKRGKLLPVQSVVTPQDLTNSLHVLTADLEGGDAVLIATNFVEFFNLLKAFPVVDESLEAVSEFCGVCYLSLSGFLETPDLFWNNIDYSISITLCSVIIWSMPDFCIPLMGSDFPQAVNQMCEAVFSQSQNYDDPPPVPDDDANVAAQALSILVDHVPFSEWIVPLIHLLLSLIYTTSSDLVIITVSETCEKMLTVDKAFYDDLCESELLMALFEATCERCDDLASQPFSVAFFDLASTVLKSHDMETGLRLIHTLPCAAYARCVATSVPEVAWECAHLVTTLLLMDDPEFQEYFRAPALIWDFSNIFAAEDAYASILEWLKFSCALMRHGDIFLVRALHSVRLLQKTAHVVIDGNGEVVGYFFLIVTAMIDTAQAANEESAVTLCNLLKANRELMDGVKFWLEEGQGDVEFTPAYRGDGFNIRQLAVTIDHFLNGSESDSLGRDSLLMSVYDIFCEPRLPSSRTSNCGCLTHTKGIPDSQIGDLPGNCQPHSPPLSLQSQGHAHWCSRRPFRRSRISDSGRNHIQLVSYCS
jgi:hypothetical protein